MVVISKVVVSVNIGQDTCRFLLSLLVTRSQELPVVPRLSSILMIERNALFLERH